MRTDKEKIIEEISGHYREILKLIGENPEREGLKKTPERAARALFDITEGYDKDAGLIASQAIFEHSGSRLVVVRDIEFYSMCEHHILPFFGKISVGYIPDGKIIGLSKLARIVDVYAKRLQVQERLTSQICKCIAEILPNKGVIVACKAQHMCMKMRGVEKQDSETLTMDFTDSFAKDKDLRKEFLDLINS